MNIYKPSSDHHMRGESSCQPLVTLRMIYERCDALVFWRKGLYRLYWCGMRIIQSASLLVTAVYLPYLPPMTLWWARVTSRHIFPNLGYFPTTNPDGVKRAGSDVFYRFSTFAPFQMTQAKCHFENYSIHISNEMLFCANFAVTMLLFICIQADGTGQTDRRHTRASRDCTSTTG